MLSPWDIGNSHLVMINLISEWVGVYMESLPMLYMLFHAVPCSTFLTWTSCASHGTAHYWNGPASWRLTMKMDWCHGFSSWKPSFMFICFFLLKWTSRVSWNVQNQIMNNWTGSSLLRKTNSKGQCFRSAIISCTGTEPFAFMALTGFPLVSLECRYKNHWETSPCRTRVI